ncbi:MAG: hypothetical protein JO045_30030 [Mycobacterium sp.]|jgi:hypothetical protein|nr:hypothetical protein [Mycobacterium sp.]
MTEIETVTHTQTETQTETETETTETQTQTETETTETETEIAYYGIAQLNSFGKPVKYLPFLGVSWTPGKHYWLTADVAQAWRFADSDAAQETVDLVNSIPGNSPELHVTELDGEGPPLTLQ